MNTSLVQVHDSVFKRALWLYGLYTLLSNAAYLVGYYLLPQGFMRGSPAVAVGRMATANDFWTEFALTLFFNLGLQVVLGIVLNLNQVKGWPAGYLVPISLGITSGLISGTNSFSASDLTQLNAWTGTALAISIGGFEMLAYLLIIASTVRLGVYQYQSWWQWKSTKVMSLRDVRLTKAEVLCLTLGVLMLVVAAYRETAMRFNLA
ncbi:MAG: hypothetical protein U0559_08980 [Anaerolineae bacterium]